MQHTHAVIAPTKSCPCTNRPSLVQILMEESRPQATAAGCCHQLLLPPAAAASYCCRLLLPATAASYCHRLLPPATATDDSATAPCQPFEEAWTRQLCHAHQWWEMRGSVCQSVLDVGAVVDDFLAGCNACNQGLTGCAAQQIIHTSVQNILKSCGRKRSAQTALKAGVCKYSRSDWVHRARG